VEFVKCHTIWKEAIYGCTQAKDKRNYSPLTSEGPLANESSAIALLMPFFRWAKEEITKTYTKWANVFQYQCVWQLHLPTWKTPVQFTRGALWKSRPALPAGINSHHRANHSFSSEPLSAAQLQSHFKGIHQKRGEMWICYLNKLPKSTLPFTKLGMWHPTSSYACKAEKSFFMPQQQFVLWRAA